MRPPAPEADPEHFFAAGPDAHAIDARFEGLDRAMSLKRSRAWRNW